MIDIESK